MEEIKEGRGGDVKSWKNEMEKLFSNSNRAKNDICKAHAPVFFVEE